MKCYNHHDRDAFAVCKSCGKALCLECAEEYKNTFICKGSKACRHVADVEFVNYFKDNSDFILENNGTKQELIDKAEGLFGYIRQVI